MSNEKIDLRAMVGRFVEVCRRGVKVNAGKSRVMMLNGEEGLECEVYVDGIRNLNIWDVFWTNQVQMGQCSRKVASGRRVAGAIRSLVNARDFPA